MSASSSPTDSPEASSKWVPLLLGGLGLAFVIATAFQIGRMGDDPTTVAKIQPPTPPPPPADTSGTIASPPEGSGQTVDTTGGRPARADASAVGTAMEDALAKVRQDLEAFRARMQTARNREESQAFWDARMELLEYLKQLDPAYAGPVLEFLETADNFLQRRVLLLGLAEMGGDTIADGLADHYDEWSQKDKREQSGSEIKYTVEALGKIDTDHSFDLLNHYLREGDPQDRSRFVEQLGLHSRREESVPTFVDLAGHDTQNRVRNKAAQALKRTAHPRSAADIEKLLETERVPYVRQTMIGALGSIGDPASLKTLDRILREDEDVSTRLSACHSTAAIGGASARRILERVAASDENQRVRTYAEGKLVELEDRRN
ncbi:MAG: HEAT repeat domain-containing protein [Planctomycetes bacterium]|nr:HEAT repeat domain-containing protein [Planctomycetota bacterium]